MSYAVYGKKLNLKTHRVYVGHVGMRDDYDNWITGSDLANLGNYKLYNAAFYFTVTTMVTVGYGDITAKNLGERIFCIFLMFFGVFTFTFGTGIIASII